QRAALFPGYLSELYAELAPARRRSCHGRSAGECCFRPCRFCRSVANAASYGSAAWISPGPHCCPRRLRCLECRPIYGTASQILGLSKRRHRVCTSRSACESWFGHFLTLSDQPLDARRRRTGCASVKVRRYSRAPWAAQARVVRGPLLLFDCGRPAEIDIRAVRSSHLQ